MNVVHLVPTLSAGGGGICNYVSNLAKAQREIDGWNPVVVAGARSGVQRDEELWHGVSTSSVSITGPAVPGFAPRLMSALRDTAPDLLHSHGLWLYHSWVAREWGKKTGRPRIVSLHGLLNPRSRHNRSSWKKALSMWLVERTNLSTATCIHVLTMEEAAAVRDAGFAQPLGIVPNAVGMPSPSTAQKAPNGRRELLYLGQLNEGKGVYELCQTWARIVDGDATLKGRWRLVIAGWGNPNYVRLLSEFIERRLLADCISMIGPVSGQAKADCYGRASAFVLPSHSEGMPTVVLEAWQYRLPVGMLDAGYFTEAFACGAAFRLVPSTLVDDLRRFVELVECDASTLVACGVREIRERYNWPTVAGRFAAIYKWMCGKADKPDWIIVN
jgi:glycosyltransferase involved in cell wall biosynthesis